MSCISLVIWGKTNWVYDPFMIYVPYHHMEFYFDLILQLKFYFVSYPLEKTNKFQRQGDLCKVRGKSYLITKHHGSYRREWCSSLSTFDIIFSYFT